jgi:tetratricopeptide (TPR) repeat protein
MRLPNVVHAYTSRESNQTNLPVPPEGIHASRGRGRSTIFTDIKPSARRSRTEVVMPILVAERADEALGCRVSQRLQPRVSETVKRLYRTISLRFQHQPKKVPFSLLSALGFSLVTLLVLVSCPVSLLAHSLLVSSRDVAIVVPNANVIVSATSVKPSQKLTYVVFIDTLNQSDVIAFLRHLTGLIGAKALPSSTTVVLAAKGSLTIRPVTDAATIVSALVQSVDTADHSNQTILDFYQLLLKTLERAEDPWESYVIIANLPEPATNHRNDIAAYLSYTCFTKKIRLSYWPFTRVKSLLTDLAVLTAGIELQEGRIDYLPSSMSGLYEITWNIPAPDHGTVTRLVSFTMENGAKIFAVPTLFVAHEPPPPLETIYRARDYALRYLEPPDSTNEKTKQITDWLDTLLSTFPADTEFLSLYLRLHKGGRDPQRAASIARDLAAVDPTNGWAYLELGKAQLAMHDLQSAETSLQTARSLGAPPIEVIEAMTSFHVAQQRPDRAFSELEEAVQHYPNVPRLGVALAQMAESAGSLNRASVALELVVAKNPEALDVRTKLVQVYLKQGLTQLALQHARKALVLVHDDPPVMKTYALFFEALNQPDEALLLWSRLRPVSEYSQAAAVATSRLLAARGDFAAAMSMIDGALAAYPDSDTVVEAKVNVLRQQGRYREALRFLRDNNPAGSVRLLTLEAQLADVMVDGAPDAYARLSRTLKVGSQGSVLRESIEKRGAVVAIRDGRRDLLSEFGGIWQAVPSSSTSSLLTERASVKAEATPAYLQGLAAILGNGTSPTEAIRTFAGRPDLHRLALALASVPVELMSALVAEHKRQPLSDETLKLLGQYGGVLSMTTDGVVLPGGSKSEMVWRRFLGGTSASGNQLLLELVRPGCETKLAFVLSLMYVDHNSQSYLTKTLSTLHSTYELFTAFIKNAGVGRQELAVERFVTLLVNFAIDPKSGISVPGTPQAWLSDFIVEDGETKGSLSNNSMANFDQSTLFLAAMAEKLSSGTSPETVETLNAAFRFSHCQDKVLDANTVAVIRKNGKLFVPTLDLLCDFAPLTSEQMQALFSMINNILSVSSRADQQVMFGQLWSVLELLRLARQSGSLDITTSETLFSQAFARKPTLSTYVNLTENTLDILQSLIEYSTARFRIAPANPRQALLSLMVPVDGGERLGELNQGVTAVTYFQKLPPIEFATKCATLARHLRNRAGDDKDNVIVLRDLLRQNTSVAGDLAAAGRADSAKILQSIMGYSVRDRSAEKLFHDVGSQGYSEVLTVLSPSISVALTGFIYAMYFSVEDPKILKDATLVRRHRFVDGNSGGPAQGLAPASLRHDQSGYYAFGRFQGLERIVAEFMVSSQNIPPEEAQRRVEQIAALRSPEVRFASNEQNMRCSLLIALGKELVMASVIAPTLWEEAKKAIEMIMSSTEMLAVDRATTEHRFEDAFNLIGTSGLYRLGIVYGRTAGKAISDSPIYQALAELEKTGSHRDLTEPWRVMFDGPAVTSTRNAGSLVLRLRELCFQNAVTASALKRLADAVAAEVAMADAADQQRRWADRAHFRQVIDSASGPSAPKAAPLSGSQPF